MRWFTPGALERSAPRAWTQKADSPRYALAPKLLGPRDGMDSCGSLGSPEYHDGG